MKAIKRYIVLFVINNFLCYTRFFEIKRMLLKVCGITVGKGSKIVGPIYFGSNIEICIGDNCWIGKNINIDGSGSLIIKDNVDIAPHVVINTGGHNIGDSSRRAGEGITSRIEIGNGVWIGTRVTIIRNTIIEDACVIAAGSLVKDNIKKNSLIAGVPAKVKKTLE